VRRASNIDPLQAAHPQGQARRVTLQLNGRTRHGYCEPRELLSDFIRHELGATGTHVGCEHGVCGACTVQVDGVAARACLMLAVQADGRSIDTVEGLASSDAMNDLQQAFQRHHALQCGFCTAGILMSCADYLQSVPQPSEAQVREMLSGHLCRCTGYTPIVAAVLDVAERRSAARAAAHAQGPREPEAEGAHA
jgi:2-furoyl-CoA dehydrogenase 2Fe-2S iron sulfur subunit